MSVDISLEGAASDCETVADALVAAGERLLALAGVPGRELSLLLTDDAHIRALNAQYRDEDHATDVLSFPMDEGELLAGPDGEEAPLGDVVISVETARRQAAETGLDLDGMALFLLVHGFCHLLGHDHGEAEEAAAMRATEDRLWAHVGGGRPRPPTPY